MKLRSNKWKSGIAVLMAVAMMTGQSMSVAAAEFDTGEVVVVAEAGTEEAVTQVENDSMSTEGIPPMGYRPLDEPVPVASVMSDAAYEAYPAYQALESRYNPLDNGFGALPQIRNQSPYGSCWAFASLAMGETANHKKGINTDLSELHLAYFTYNSVNDPLGGLEGDSNEVIGGTFMDLGGNLYFSGKILANWIGAADEATVPYENAKVALANGLDSSLAYKDSLHLQAAYTLNLATDAPLVKEYIKKNGSVGIAYGHYDECYSAKYNSYYCDESEDANHAVTIVGWDDNFPATNFVTQPEGNGAWLVRNSWGKNEYDERGYFWMSYYDRTLENAAYVFEYENADNYDHNYQYDGAMLQNNIGTGSSTRVANIFTPAVKNGNGEVLKAVGMAVGSVNTDYTIEVYTNLTDGGNPESGTLVTQATTTGKTLAEGYYTIPLNYPVTLRNNAPFAVVVTLSKPFEKAYVGSEISTTGSWFRSVANAKSGQSFIKFNGSWLDYGAQYNRNIKIKAFTSEVENLPFSDVDLIENNWKYESIKYVSKKGMMNAITGTDQFMPDRTLSRGMFVTVLYRSIGSPAVNWQNKFTDAVNGKWYSGAVIWAADNGIVSGYKDGSFGVDTNITREQIAKMLYLYAQQRGYDVSAKGDLSAYTDSIQVNSWAWEYMQWAVGVGMISGKPNGNGTYRLDPKGEATRAECAAMLMRFANKYGN